MEVVKMRKELVISLSLCLILFVGFFATSADAATRFGGGIHYLRTLGDIKDSPEFDENAIGFMASIVTGRSLRLEGDLEVIPDFGGSGETMLQPQAYAMLGEFIYGGLGIGIGYFDGEWQSQPFYAFRAGVNLPLGGFGIDLFATYRFQNDENLENFQSDDLNTITFGALLRFGGGGSSDRR